MFKGNGRLFKHLSTIPIIIKMESPINNRWHLILGTKPGESDVQLSSEEQHIDDLLKTAYGEGKDAGFGRSVQKMRKWLDGIRQHFKTEVVSLIQKDALERQNAKELLLEPELLEKIEPDISLVATILSLQYLLPDRTRYVARKLVERAVIEIEKKLKTKLSNAVRQGASNHSKRENPSIAVIDWKKTIQNNLRNYQEEQQILIPKNWFGFRKGNKLKEIVLLIDKSESMMNSAIHASVIGAILASLKTIKTHLIFFDTEITDVTDKYQDPVDILFSVPMGGGTDIGLSLNYVDQKLTRHSKAIVFLISDLDDFGSTHNLELGIKKLLNKNTHIQCLLALNEDGRAEHNTRVAQLFKDHHISVYGCIAEKFPEILCEELQKIV